MPAYLLYAAAALYLGVVTSISPCPLATNIAAIAYVGRKVGSARAILAAGLLYTLGRCLLYAALAALLTCTALSLPAVSLALQKSMHLILVPVLTLLGMVLVGLIRPGFGRGGTTARLQKRIDALGVWGALPLGMLFAVSFCPTSAAWFFGLIALVMGAEAGAITAMLAQVGIDLPPTPPLGAAMVLPIVYGVGTALPVLAVAFVLAFTAQSIGRTYNMLSKVEWWSRQITGWVFIAAGVYFSLRYIFELF
jgi:cytochrome c-type biogenesis protein